MKIKKIKISVFFILLFALISTSTAFSQDENPAIISAIRNLEAKTGTQINIIWHADKQRIKTLTGNKLSEPYRGTPEEAAIQFLRENRNIFQLRPDMSDIKVSRVQDIGAGGKRVEFKQTFNGLPVFDGGVDIILKSDNSIDLVHNYYVPALLISTQPSLSETQIVDIAINDFSAHCMAHKSKYGPPESCQGVPINLRESPQPQFGIFSGQLVYRLILNVELPRALSEYTIDANSGQILKKLDLIQNFIGNGYVFDPNPVNRLYWSGVTLTDNNDRNSSAFSRAYTLRNLDDIQWVQTQTKNYFYLTGPYVDVTDSLESPYYFNKTSGRISVNNATFNFTRDKEEFEHVMVYYHIDNNQRYIQSLGFTAINNRSIKADPHGLSGADNSHYIASPLGAGYWLSAKAAWMMQKMQISYFMNMDML